jgi:drug/metabolite transporter superfamily protein YnfA
MQSLNLPGVAWLVFLAAAILEVGGDAVVRKGLRGGGWLFVAAGAAMLASYGLMVNLIRWDFSKLLGVYVAVFAAVSVMAGKFVFGEDVPTTTWTGLALIMLGGAVIQVGAR